METMKIKWTLSVCLAVMVCLSLPKISRALPDSNFQRLFNVGYRVLDLKYQNKKHSQTVTVAVWYPTAAQPELHCYGGPTKGFVSIDAAPLADGNAYPLLVFSHGYGGSGIGSVFFTEALAARGWIVACPDHNDRHSAVRIRNGQLKNFDRIGLLRHAKEISVSSPEDREKYLYRLDEMQIVLDSMLSSDLFGKIINRDCIAVGGHSFGGFTALGLCGAIKERYDPRIKALLLFSTGAGGYLYKEEELKNVRIPTMLFMGELEADQRRGLKTMYELSTKIYSNVSSPKYFLVIKGANHFSFNNRFVDNYWSGLLSGNEEQFNVIRLYSIAFLEKHVSGKNDYNMILEQKNPMLVEYLKDSNIDAANVKIEENKKKNVQN
ncbi:MAG: hypothetical protein Kow0029_30300 [Candidatus Rifleibacteriota bacterium]